VKDALFRGEIRQRAITQRRRRVPVRPIIQLIPCALIQVDDVRKALQRHSFCPRASSGHYPNSLSISPGGNLVASGGKDIFSKLPASDQSHDFFRHRRDQDLGPYDHEGDSCFPSPCSGANSYFLPRWINQSSDLGLETLNVLGYFVFLQRSKDQVSTSLFRS
jgi:hypothetical protein